MSEDGKIDREQWNQFSRKLFANIVDAHLRIIDNTIPQEISRGFMGARMAAFAEYAGITLEDSDTWESLIAKVDDAETYGRAIRIVSETAARQSPFLLLPMIHYCCGPIVFELMELAAIDAFKADKAGAKAHCAMLDKLCHPQHETKN